MPKNGCISAWVGGSWSGSPRAKSGDESQWRCEVSFSSSVTGSPHTRSAAHLAPRKVSERWSCTIGGVASRPARERFDATTVKPKPQCSCVLLECWVCAHSKAIASADAVIGAFGQLSHAPPRRSDLTAAEPPSLKNEIVSQSPSSQLHFASNLSVSRSAPGHSCFSVRRASSVSFFLPPPSIERLRSVGAAALYGWGLCSVSASVASAAEGCASRRPRPAARSASSSLRSAVSSGSSSGSSRHA